MITTSRDWDRFIGRKISIPFFIFECNDTKDGPLEGFCRGSGGLTGYEERYEDAIGLHTTDGVLYEIVIDTRIECILPMFFISNEAFYHPIICCSTLCDGRAVIDPATGMLAQARLKT